MRWGTRLLPRVPPSPFSRSEVGLGGTNSEAAWHGPGSPPLPAREGGGCGSVPAGPAEFFCDCFLTVSILGCGPQGTLPTTPLSEPEPSQRHPRLQEHRPHPRRRRPRHPQAGVCQPS